jgi:hypothetical protein
MISRVCICCGERMPQKGPVLSHNPNLCAACATITDQLEDAGPSSQDDLLQIPSFVIEDPQQIRRAA